MQISWTIRRLPLAPRSGVSARGVHAAALVVVFVAFARMYRGMHHPLDIAGGVVVGVAALCAFVLISRATHLAARAEDR